ncbi:division/cell wall cluster transcriptional repressor MraZ [Teredinibacter franksiae]|uniref:division/cell wall cluster transcriptional repressor MraZ n=1 Tax=Teredinibacter franksiae TaxID=2761453 RepID=UPI001625F06F|nr:division/cell wall cluster transcriptional repressor MraZ [Teredinibacter franksiae]
MFQGSHAINMDAKGRMAIPAKYRDSLASACDGRIVMTAHTQDRCVLVYPEPEWQTILPKIEALPTFNKASLRAQRLLIGYATPLELDGNGRVLVPPTLRDYAKLDKKLMLVGLGKKFELWSEEAWLASVADLETEDDLPEAMMSLTL